MIAAIARALTRPRRSPAPGNGATIHFRLNVATPESAHMAVVGWEAVRDALAPALAREAAAHLAQALGEETQP